MNMKPVTLEEIRTMGLEALARELGPVGVIRFLQQFESGHGDYSKERHQWLTGRDVQTLAEEMRRGTQFVEDETTSRSS